MLLACVSLGIKIVYCLYRVFQKSGILVQQTITPLKSIKKFRNLSVSEIVWGVSRVLDVL